MVSWSSDMINASNRLKLIKVSLPYIKMVGQQQKVRVFLFFITAVMVPNRHSFSPVNAGSGWVPCLLYYFKMFSPRPSIKGKA